MLDSVCGARGQGEVAIGAWMRQRSTVPMASGRRDLEDGAAREFEPGQVVRFVFRATRALSTTPASSAR